MNTAVNFTDAAKTALKNPTLRSNFRQAMDSLRERRAAQFPDQDELERARDLAGAIRRRSLNHLAENLVHLSRSAKKMGFRCIGPKLLPRRTRLFWRSASATTPNM